MLDAAVGIGVLRTVGQEHAIQFAVRSVAEQTYGEVEARQGATERQGMADIASRASHVGGNGAKMDYLCAFLTQTVVLHVRAVGQ